MMNFFCRHIGRLLAGTGLSLLLLASSSWALDIVLVAHPDTQVEILSQQDVELIFLGKKSTWKDGSRIVPHVQAQSSTTDSFLREMLNLTYFQYYRYWRNALFTGQGSPPKVLTDDNEITKRLLSTPGGIGYVSQKPDRDSGLKVVAVKAN
jgi:ABC-type phosphate transport system substrate-binding protein